MLELCCDRRAAAYIANVRPCLCCLGVSSAIAPRVANAGGLAYYIPCYEFSMAMSRPAVWPAARHSASSRDFARVVSEALFLHLQRDERSCLYPGLPTAARDGRVEPGLISFLKSSSNFKKKLGISLIALFCRRSWELPRRRGTARASRRGKVRRCSP